MKSAKYHVYLTEAERSQVIRTLIDLKNELMLREKYTDAVDELIVKFTSARQKKLKIEYI